MLIVLPFLSLLLIFIRLFSWKLTSKLVIREKIIIALILWFLLFVILTESLNPFHLITVQGLNISWILVVFILAILTFKTYRWKSLPIISWPDNFTDKTLLVAIILISLVTLLLAISVAPNDNDAMTYHLARIPHWIQNQSVSYYATHFDPQIYLSPFASYPSLHFRLLSGGDWFSNLTQWMCMIGSLLIVSLITKYFGGDKKTQILASFIAATIPMGILQASSSQDDYILAFFMVSFVYFALCYKSWKSNKSMIFLSGLSLGLSFFTKQTAYIYALPFIFWFLWRWTSEFGLKKGLIYILILGGTAVTVNLGFYFRNINFVGWPIFSLRDYYLNDPVGIQSLITGVIKNIALNLSTPITQINNITYILIDKLHSTLGIPLNYAGYNSQPYSFVIPRFLAVEYTAPNTSHLLLFFASLIFLLKKITVEKSKIIYSIITFSGFVIFSTIIRWQPSFSRLHLPIFVLISPIIPFALIKWNVFIRNTIFLILLVSSFFFLFFNRGKPIISISPIFFSPRNEQYFLNWVFSRSQYQQYLLLGKFAQKNSCTKVGLIYTDDYGYIDEYPFWVILKQNNKNVQIEHIDVQNPTKQFSNRNFIPDCIVFLSEDKNRMKTFIDKGIPVVEVK